MQLSAKHYKLIPNITLTNPVMSILATPLYVVKCGVYGETHNFLILAKTQIVSTRQNRLYKAVLTSTHNLCFEQK